MILCYNLPLVEELGKYTLCQNLSLLIFVYIRSSCFWDNMLTKKKTILINCISSLSERSDFHPVVNLSKAHPTLQMHMLTLFSVCEILLPRYISDEIKQEFFQALAMSVLQYSCTAWIEEKAWWELCKDAAACSFEQILAAAPNKTAVARPLVSHLTNYSSKTS